MNKINLVFLPFAKLSLNILEKDENICNSKKCITEINKKVVYAKFAHTTEQGLKNRETMNIGYLNLNAANLDFNEITGNFSFSEC